MTDQRPVRLQTFRERLASLIEARGIGKSAFAEGAGIDRSTLSQLLSPTNRRLPRVETLVAIATSSGASIDWLLGLSHDGPVRTEVVKEVKGVARHDLSAADEAFIAWYAEAAATKVRYVPSTMPDLLKTGAVIRHEVARYATTRPEQKMETAHARLTLARTPASDLECCNSVQAVEGFARGEDMWATLDVRRRVEQLDQMIDLCEELYPRFRWHLYDARQRYAAPVTVFGVDRAVIYLGQMYLVLSGEDHVLAFIAQFDDLVRAAVVQPTDVPKLLRRLRAEIVG
jgi:transcriptional regulator with XRE-family HTH domain